MRNRVKTWVSAVAVAIGLAGFVVTAQSAYPCPKNCDPAWLEANYGADWHFYYFLNGCWLLDPPCGQIGIGENLRQLPRESAMRPRTVVR